MNIYTIADLHLNLSVPEKSMEVFGPSWKDYVNKIKENWQNSITNDDLVLIPGDISWAITLDEAKIDLDWIDCLPGTKVMIKGNHDYWWGSLKKLTSILPPSIHAIQNNAFHIDNIAIGGTRLWDTIEYNFNDLIEFQEPVTETTQDAVHIDLSEKIFERELHRLKLSLSQLNPKAKTKIAMVHYPPISSDLKDSKASKILEHFHIDICVFGHLHNVKTKKPIFGEKNSVKYVFSAGDFINFNPIKIL